MTSATPKPRAGEHGAAQNCAKTSTVSASRCSLCGQQMRGTDWADRVLNENNTLRHKESQTQKLWEESSARNSKLEAERDSLRERERELVEALKEMEYAFNNDASMSQLTFEHDALSKARALLAKHGR